VNEPPVPVGDQFIGGVRLVADWSVPLPVHRIVILPLEIVALVIRGEAGAVVAGAKKIKFACTSLFAFGAVNRKVCTPERLTVRGAPEASLNRE